MSIGFIEQFRQIGRDAKFRAKMRFGEVRVPGAPYFDDELLAVFPDLIANAQSYLEFGTGGSTMLADQLNIKTLGIESDPAFAKAVRSKLSHGTRVDVRYVDIGMVGEWGVPTMRKVTEYRARRWLRYVTLPFEAGSEKNFDVVLIDGRFRCACALAAAKHAAWSDADCTIVFDDYVPRPHYTTVENWLGTPRLVGRAAIFRIRGRTLARSINDIDVETAARDWS